MSAVYPERPDWDAYALSALSRPTGSGAAGDAWLALWSPIAQLYAQVGEVVLASVDVQTAAGSLLDIVGARVGEYRGGLGDTEYRSIIAGRRVSVGSLGRAVDVVAVCEALGGVAGTVRVRGYAGCLFVSFEVQFSPTATWTRRAGRVIRDAVDATYDLEAVAYTASSLIWDGSPGWDLGAWSYLLPSE